MNIPLFFPVVLVLSLTSDLVSPALATAIEASEAGEGANTSIPAGTSPPPPHHCIHDKLVAARALRSGGKVQAVTRVVYRAAAAAATTAQEVGTTAEWQTIRISVFTPDLDDPSSYCTEVGQRITDEEDGIITCTSEQILTEAKRELLVNKLLPAAIKLHVDRLRVRPVDRIVVSREGAWGGFHPPASHFTTGVSDTDFVLYLTAAPTTGNVAAWALTQQLDPETLRPLVGVANISPQYITDSSFATRIIAHELLHALGFHDSLFLVTSTAATGGDPMSISVQGVREKSTTTLALSSPNVLAAAREHYGCPAMQYVELEDQGGDGSAGSHWKMRNAKDELMAPTSGANIYTAMTIAVMEDLGFYKGNYDKAEPMAWGKDAGCSLFSSKCIINGQSQDPSMFCTSASSTLQCTSNRASLGNCGTTTYSSPLPDAMRYFPQSNVGGTSAFMDYCPVIEADSSTSCQSGDASRMPGSLVASSGRCLDSLTGITVHGEQQQQTALCVEVQCSETTQTYQIRVKGSSVFVDCPVGGSVSPSASSGDVFQLGALLCPDYWEVCSEIVQPITTETNAATSRPGVLPSVTATILLVLLFLFFYP